MFWFLMLREDWAVHDAAFLRTEDSNCEEAAGHSAKRLFGLETRVCCPSWEAFVSSNYLLELDFDRKVQFSTIRYSTPLIHRNEFLVYIHGT